MKLMIKRVMAPSLPKWACAATKPCRGGSSVPARQWIGVMRNPDWLAVVPAMTEWSQGFLKMDEMAKRMLQRGGFIGREWCATVPLTSCVAKPRVALYRACQTTFSQFRNKVSGGILLFGHDVQMMVTGNAPNIKIAGGRAVQMDGQRYVMMPDPFLLDGAEIEDQNDCVALYFVCMQRLAETMKGL